MDKVQKAGILFFAGIALIYVGPIVPILSIILRPIISLIHEFGALGYYGAAALLYFIVIAAVGQDVLEKGHSKLWLPLVTFFPAVGLIAYELARD